MLIDYNKIKVYLCTFLDKKTKQIYKLKRKNNKKNNTVCHFIGILGNQNIDELLIQKQNLFRYEFLSFYTHKTDLCTLLLLINSMFL